VCPLPPELPPPCARRAVARQRRVAVDDGTVGEEAGTDEVALGQPALDRPRQFERRIGGRVVHVANAGDAVREEQREMPLRVAKRAEVHVPRHVGDGVDVHVPQARDEESARAVDQVRIVRYPDLLGRTYGRDAIARQKNGLFATEDPFITSTTVTARIARSGPSPRVADRHGRRPRLRAGGEQQAGDTQQDLHHLPSI
jgi:hypothetical protein